jgi:hypothetical protein
LRFSNDAAVSIALPKKFRTVSFPQSGFKAGISVAAFSVPYPGCGVVGIANLNLDVIALWTVPPRIEGNLLQSAGVMATHRFKCVSN